MTARFRTVLLALLVLLLLALLPLAACDQIQHWLGKDSPSAPIVLPARSDGTVAMLLPDFTQLVERAGPAVVNIQATRSGDQVSDDAPEAEPQDDPLFDFFRRFMPNPNDPGLMRPPSDSVSMGSGFIISTDGYIMTNAHVVMNANPIKVMLTDKRELQARLVGLDLRTDVALLKVSASDLPAVKIGNPAQLKPGEWVAAIGAPFGFQNSVTSGIVSALGRNLPDENYVPFIQTDVAINPGNSGGPLFNLKGEVVGINSQIYSRSGGFMGISFSIPIDLAMNVAEQIKTKGKVSRGQLGIGIQEVTPELAQSFGLSQARGALVVSIAAQGPAAQAGILPGDIILQVNQQDIVSSSELPILVGALRPGSQVRITLWRKGKQLSMEATLGELASEPVQQSRAPERQKSYEFGKLGLTVSEMPASVLAQQGLKGGLQVLRAIGLVGRAGLQSGDIIIGVNQNDIGSVKEFEQALNAAKGNAALLVRRNNDTLYIPLRLLQ